MVCAVIIVRVSVSGGKRSSCLVFAAGYVVNRYCLIFTETKGVVRFVILSTITVQCLSRVASIVTAGYIVNQYYFVFAKGVVRLIVAGYVLT